MARTLEDLASSVVSPSGEKAPVDRGIKGTLIDDAAIAILMKVATLLTILILGSILYLWLERAIGAKNIIPFRIWTPTIAWLGLGFFTKPFLRFGWWGMLATFAILPTTSGYLWQLFQSMVGTR